MQLWVGLAHAKADLSDTHPDIKEPGPRGGELATEVGIARGQSTADEVCDPPRSQTLGLQGCIIGWVPARRRASLSQSSG
jgi:hypothetical protein